MQNSLYSGTGIPCCSRTFTCKISAAYPGALGNNSLNDSASTLKLSLNPFFERLSESLHKANTMLHVATEGERFATLERSTIHIYLMIVDSFIREASVELTALQQAIKDEDQDNTA
jgi:hypothetical protein